MLGHLTKLTKLTNEPSQPSRISERSADPAPIELSSRLIGAGQGISTDVEMPLQIDLFMQNKPNLVRRRRIANSVYTTDYEFFLPLAGQKNKPNTNPNKTNLRRARMNINSLITKDYRKKDDFAVRKNKPNQTQFQRQKNDCTDLSIKLPEQIDGEKVNGK